MISTFHYHILSFTRNEKTDILKNTSRQACMMLLMGMLMSMSGNKFGKHGIA